ncbi:MAG: hypothetical protein ACRBCI_13850 [Cellvibrionaceae bacterium]
MKHIFLFLFFSLPFFSVQAEKTLSAAERLHQHACAIKPYVHDNPWHIANLYDCTTRELYVPYQLWSGAEWNGDKQGPCMHAVDHRSVLSQPSDQYSSGEIIRKGPISWHDKHTGETLKVWERIRPSINSRKYYTCHPRGIGIIHNLSRPNEKYIRGLCRAPAGFGWKIGKRRVCIKTTVEIDELVLDKNNLLESLYVKYWFRDKLKYRYLYKPNQGTTEIFLYKK